MNSRLQDWIVKRIAVGAFSRRSDVLRFAALRSIWTTLAAVVLSRVVNGLAASFGILGLTHSTNLAADILVTTLVAGPICFMAYYLVGKAILDLAVSRREFERLSRTDPLTGLMNRRAFTDVIASLDKPYIVAVLDIDRFKAVNDTYGHGAGDLVLVEVARELKRMLGRDAAVARLGGEEFGVILRDRDKADAVAVMELVRATLAARVFHVEGHDISVTLSVGISRGSGGAGYSVPLTHADQALYIAKASGRNRIVHEDDVLVAMPPLARTEPIAV